MTYLKKIVLASALSIAVFAPASNAALVTEILGLNIEGTDYDVTFNSGATFNDLWDADGDGDFTDADGSTFNVAPTFWSNQTGAEAEAAANAIVVALGSVDHVDIRTSHLLVDLFQVPYEFATVANQERYC